MLQERISINKCCNRVVGHDQEIGDHEKNEIYINSNPECDDTRLLWDERAVVIGNHCTPFESPYLKFTCVVGIHNYECNSRSSSLLTHREYVTVTNRHSSNLHSSSDILEEAISGEVLYRSMSRSTLVNGAYTLKWCSHC
jgi:hypothetical protein